MLIQKVSTNLPITRRLAAMSYFIEAMIGVFTLSHYRVTSILQNSVSILSQAFSLPLL